MVAGVVDGLAWLGGLSGPLAWLVVAAFLAGAVVEYRDRDLARPVVAGAWVLFGAFWLTQVHQFALVEKSIIEGVGTVIAVPACLSVAAMLLRGRDSLFVLSRSVAVMGLIFLPAQAVPAVQRLLTETVTAQTAALIRLLGIEPTVVDGLTVDGKQIADKHQPYRTTFVFYHEGEPLTYTIVLACTGIGSIAVLAGLITAVDAPVGRKLRALAVSVPVIYVLNLLRNVFIAVGFGTQRFHLFPDVVGTLFAVESDVMVSYYVADRLIAQSLSVVALVVITLGVVRVLPEMVTVVEDALYVLTRREVDLVEAFGLDVDHPVRADGGETPD